MSEHDDFIDALFPVVVTRCCIGAAVAIAIIGGLYAWLS